MGFKCPICKKDFRNKKRGKFNTCKKTELISLIMFSGVDLAGKVPNEILTAAAKLEHPEDDEE